MFQKNLVNHSADCSTWMSESQRWNHQRVVHTLSLWAETREHRTRRLLATDWHRAPVGRPTTTSSGSGKLGASASSAVCTHIDAPVTTNKVRQKKTSLRVKNEISCPKGIKLRRKEVLAACASWFLCFFRFRPPEGFVWWWNFHLSMALTSHLFH